MKLIICGKGGSGKSTITTLLARQYARSGKRVIVIDTDVSNTGIHRILGTEASPDLFGSFGGKKSVMDTIKAARENNIPLDQPLLGTWTYDTIPNDYGPQRDGVKLVTVGKLRDVGEGCTCTISALARQFIMGLTLMENDVVIIDTEAGIEHFGRGLDKLCDATLMVVEPSRESMCLISKVTTMAESIEVPLFYILNKTDNETSQILRGIIPDKDKIIGEFPVDVELLDAGLEGRPMESGYDIAGTIIGNIQNSNCVC